MTHLLLDPHRSFDPERGKHLWTVGCSCGWLSDPCKGGETLEKVAARHLHMRAKPPCPTPHKQRFKTEADAEDALARFWRTSGKGKRMPHRVYKCPCGKWHTSSNPLPAFAA